MGADAQHVKLELQGDDGTKATNAGFQRATSFFCRARRIRDGLVSAGY